MGAFGFGKSESIHCITDVKLQGKEGEALCLAYKTSTFWLGAGVWLKDDGYVLREKNASDSYYPFPSPAKVTEYQQAGLLPSPLPAYKVDPIDYIFGFSLWWILPFILIGSWWQSRKKSTQQTNPADPHAGG